MKGKKKLGFTLVELLIGMTIIVSLMVMMIGVINPSAMISKARDAERKSDLNKIKKAFEEYWNDKGYYPKSDSLNSWNVTANCDKRISEISKYLDTWPCDPNGIPYTLVSMDNWFKVVVNLENKKDNDIPEHWYDEGTYLTSGFNKDAANYGVSSTNVLWYEGGGLCDLTTCYNDSHCNAAVGNHCDEDEDDRVDCYYESLSTDLNRRCNDPVCNVRRCGL